MTDDKIDIPAQLVEAAARVLWQVKSPRGRPFDELGATRLPSSVGFDRQPHYLTRHTVHYLAADYLDSIAKEGS